MQTMIKNKLL